MNDKEIIKGLKKQDQGCFLKVIDTYSRYVYVIVRHVLGEHVSKEDVEEVVSDVFAKIWFHSQKIEEDRPLKPYIVAVARNTAIDKLRKQENTVSLEEMEENKQEIAIQEGSYEIDSQLEMKEQMAIVQAVLERTESPDREIFVLFYFCYARIREIAKLYEVSESKVKMTLSRMRNRMKKELEAEGYGKDS